ncbi:MAG: hypothetical protein ACXVC6_14870 [Bacteroidia bacterium]
MNKYFKEVITSKSLEFKLSGQLTGRFTDALIESNPELKAQFKNVCAPIPLKLNEELESTLGILGLSKREFMTMAIASALEEAKAIMDEIDITEYHVEFAEARKAEEEARIQHAIDSSNGGA